MKLVKGYIANMLSQLHASSPITVVRIDVNNHFLDVNWSRPSGITASNYRCVNAQQ
jgi:hypothetical protein